MYIKMTVKEALDLIAADTIVLVSVQDLKKENTIAGFTKKYGRECKKFIEEAKTIAGIHDEYFNQIRIFTEKQNDIFNYEPRGVLRTILLKG